MGVYIFAMFQGIAIAASLSESPYGRICEASPICCGVCCWHNAGWSSMASRCSGVLTVIMECTMPGPGEHIYSHAGFPPLHADWGGPHGGAGSLYSFSSAIFHLYLVFPAII